jgi:hypothetical protein
MKINLKTIKGEIRENCNLKIYKSTKDQLLEIANKNGLSLSNVIRSAINDLIEKENK